MSESAVGKSVIKKVAGLSVVCSELTVGQVRGLLQQNSDGDLLDELLLEDVRLADLPVFTGLPAEDLEQMLPSDLDVLVEGCKEANPSFFRMLAKLASLQKSA